MLLFYTLCVWLMRYVPQEIQALPSLSNRASQKGFDTTGRSYAERLCAAPLLILKILLFVQPGKSYHDIP